MESNEGATPTSFWTLHYFFMEIFLKFNAIIFLKFRVARNLISNDILKKKLKTVLARIIYTSQDAKMRYKSWCFYPQVWLENIF